MGFIDAIRRGRLDGRRRSDPEEPLARVRYRFSDPPEVDDESGVLTTGHGKIHHRQFATHGPSGTRYQWRGLAGRLSNNARPVFSQKDLEYFLHEAGDKFEVDIL